MTKKGTDCTRIQQDVRTANPNIRVSVRKTADKRYCAIPDNTLLSTNFALHKSPNAKQKYLFFRQSSLNNSGEKGHVLQATLCKLHCAVTAGGKECINICRTASDISLLQQRQCIVKLYFTIVQLPGFARVRHLQPAFLINCRRRQN
jgi:hypothetical protein